MGHDKMENKSPVIYGTSAGVMLTGQSNRDKNTGGTMALLASVNYISQISFLAVTPVPVKSLSISANVL